eukprot:TRINITY_DN1034_c0_g1_i2.p3 TRINITY_DN1034_c0_g1~~TRINITY_DN1034_c0_g1_i2.p3  ORF type:complete len:122 (+),score=31.75 TRINITY_DN1034_c0_g1_i2:141-506(+)
MSLTMKTVITRSPVCARTVRPSRAMSVNVSMSAQESRRNLLAGFIATGALLPVFKSEAVSIPYQESMGGLGVGGGSLPKNTSTASMSSYTMEGTKKRGISPKRKAQVLAKVKAAAKKAASS